MFTQDFVPLPLRVPLTRQQGRAGPSTPSRLAPPSSLPTLPFNSSLEDFFVPEVKLHHPPRGPEQGVPCPDSMEDLHQRALGQGKPILLVVDRSPRERGRSSPSGETRPHSSSHKRSTWFPTDVRPHKSLLLEVPLRGAFSTFREE